MRLEKDHCVLWNHSELLETWCGFFNQERKKIQAKEKIILHGFWETDQPEVYVLHWKIVDLEKVTLGRFRRTGVSQLEFTMLGSVQSEKK